MKTAILFLIFSFITLSTHADWVLATLLRIGANYTNEVPSDVRRIDFSNNVSDDMRDWRLAQYVIPTQYPSLVNTRLGVSIPASEDLEADKIKALQMFEQGKGPERQAAENKFFNLCVQVIAAAGLTPEESNPKLGFDELNALLEQINQIDPGTALMLSARLLAINSELIKIVTSQSGVERGINWWEEATFHPELSTQSIKVQGKYIDQLNK